MVRQEHIYCIGEVVNGVEIVEQLRIRHGKHTQKGYKVKCVKDEYSYQVDELSLKKGKGCRVCARRITVKGINDLATTHPEFVKYFVNPIEATEVTISHGKRVRVKCLECGSEKFKTVSSLTSFGVCCEVCGDGVSYGEKFLAQLLQQMNCEFVTQFGTKNKKWCGRYKYDFYLPQHNCIIEVHGMQHYSRTFGKRSLEEEKQNDIIKKQLALKNGINTYIEIDCRNSEIEWIKNSIQSSKLREMFDLKQVDWLKCEEFTKTSRMIKAINLWNNKQEMETANSLSKLIGVSRPTFTSYLKKGTVLGLCEYNPSSENKRINSLKTGGLSPSSKKVLCDGVEFGSVKECEDYYEEYRLGRWLRGDAKMPVEWHEKGLRFADEDIVYETQNGKGLPKKDCFLVDYYLIK